MVRKFRNEPARRVEPSGGETQKLIDPEKGVIEVHQKRRIAEEMRVEISREEADGSLDQGQLIGPAVDEGKPEIDAHQPHHCGEPHDEPQGKVSMTER